MRPCSTVVLGFAGFVALAAGCGKASEGQAPSTAEVGAAQPPKGTVSNAAPSDAGAPSDAVTPRQAPDTEAPRRNPEVPASAETPVAVDARPPIVEIPWKPPFTGRPSFAVTAQLQLLTETGGHTEYHRFTLVLDAAKPVAIMGVDGGGTSVALQQTGTNKFHFANTVSIPTLQYVCPIGDAEYDDFNFTITPTGELEGGGHGTITTVIGGEGSSFSAAMTLTGIADTVGPTLSLFHFSDLYDPFERYTLLSSEPLPLDPPVVLRGSGGDSIELKPVPGDVGIAFESPGVMLRYGETYGIDVDAIRDFAGLAPTLNGSVTRSMREAPPLLPEDGFESLLDASLLGRAQVLTDPGSPIISGARSLYVFPEAPFGGYEAPFAARLALARGDTVLRFSYRIVSAAASGGDDVEFLVGSPGGSIVEAALPASGTRTPGKISVNDVMLGPLATATIDLPPDAAGELVLMHAFAERSCSASTANPVGVIIDDLRVE